jgi:hypothetical protein
MVGAPQLKCFIFQRAFLHAYMTSLAVLTCAFFRAGGMQNSKRGEHRVSKRLFYGRERRPLSYRQGDAATCHSGGDIYTRPGQKTSRNAVFGPYSESLATTSPLWLHAAGDFVERTCFALFRRFRLPARQFPSRTGTTSPVHAQQARITTSRAAAILRDIEISSPQR